ncbi:hypothetical protein TUM18999_45070 [Pseudomonas tohonis]|uniref:Uncharacterized protein n=1 Tax=Pseudomonas tohonis TaxID=2725477 RepID=A0A6J4EAM7_9PSED|nr:hypothetical protein TUM18999_45070 [Pseudomonas tohonis]GJN50951.1 hypothetical protein TUM20286_07030 [Pseudomonas tohonis]
MLVAEAGHLQGIGHATAGLLGQGLDHRIAIVVGHQNGVLRLQFGCDLRPELRLFIGSQLPGLLRGEMGLDEKTFGEMGHVCWTCERVARKPVGSPPAGPGATRIGARMIT